jgi:hypothetical protein
MRRIGVIAVPGAFDSALTNVLDVLGVAEELRETVDPEISAIENVICRIGRSRLLRAHTQAALSQTRTACRKRRGMNRNRTSSVAAPG